MLKKKVGILVVLLILAFVPLVFTGCFSDEESKATYTVQYSNNGQIYKVEVEDGATYSIDVPTKTGYVFSGLYDAEVGGTKYVSADGVSVSAFYDKKNIVLYAQFLPIDYTLFFNIQDAEVVGGFSNSKVVTFGQNLGSLPTNLSKKNQEFVGWFTQPNGQGVQVSNLYGVLPNYLNLNEELAELANDNKIITLYANFEARKFEVTLYVNMDGSGTPITNKYAYGTTASEIIVPNLVNGQAVLSWSTRKNDTEKEYLFIDIITGEIILYACEYAPIITFDTNGGLSVNSIVAVAGSKIVLPKPSKTGYEFVGWKDEMGNYYTSTIMPSESIKLKAEWNAVISFDVNGGNYVSSISTTAGDSITLPKTSKENYIFAGWYDKDGNIYTSTTMPSESIKLKAGWYAIKKNTQVLISENSQVVSHYDCGLMLEQDQTIRLSKLVPTNYNGKITLKCSVKIKKSDKRITDMLIGFYSQAKVSSAYQIYLASYTTGLVSEWMQANFAFDVDSSLENIFVAFGYNESTAYASKHTYYKDFHVQVEYADESKVIF